MRTPLPFAMPGTLWQVVRDFTIGAWARQRGLGYGYVAWKYNLKWDTVRCGWRWWSFWQHPIRNTITRWKLRKL